MQNDIKVWDPLVRLFHWSLVITFVVTYLSGEGEWETLHANAGYIIGGLIAFRLIWGFIGGRHARFSDFIYRPAEIAAYLKSLATRHPKHYLGHNPAGGVMVIVMLITLALVTWTGLMAYAGEGKGPLAAGSPITISQAWADDDWSYGKGYGHKEDEFWEELHEGAANFMLLLIFVHLAGVAVSSLLHGENLARAMLTGRKANPDKQDTLE